jgi:hypothetical protein
MSTKTSRRACSSSIAAGWWGWGAQPGLHRLFEAFDFAAGGGVVGSSVLLGDAEAAQFGLEGVGSSLAAGEAGGEHHGVVGERRCWWAVFLSGGRVLAPLHPPFEDAGGAMSSARSCSSSSAVEPLAIHQEPHHAGIGNRHDRRARLGVARGPLGVDDGPRLVEAAQQHARVVGRIPRVRRRDDSHPNHPAATERSGRRHRVGPRSPNP